MARAQNPIPTVKLQLSTTPQVVEALERLALTGKFGKTSTEVGEELLRLKLREVELEGWLAPTKEAARARRERSR